MFPSALDVYLRWTVDNKSSMDLLVHFLYSLKLFVEGGIHREEILYGTPGPSSKACFRV